MSTVGPSNTGEDISSATGLPDPEVVPQAKRRWFSAEYKLRVLEEADGCAGPGENGALLRREGLYSSHLSKWRQQRRAGRLQAPSAKKRGRKATANAELEAELVKLRAQNKQLQTRLEQAEAIIEVQTKLSQLLGLVPSEKDGSE